MRLARTVYDQIAADADGAWDDLRDELSVGLFVDLNRMLMADPVPESAASVPVEPAAEAQDENEVEDDSGNAPEKKKSKQPAATPKKGAPKKGGSATKAAPGKKKRKK
jgi:hypothetical protein